MKINFAQIKEFESIDYSSLLEEYFDEKSTIVKKVNSSSGKILLEKINNVLRIRFDIKMNVQVVSSYTNVDFPYDIHLDDELFLTDDKDLETDEMILVDDLIDLDYYVYSLLISSIPITIHKKGEKFVSGESFSVMTEEEYKKLKSEEKSSPFDVLKDIDFDN